jgi:hypothetical protein
MLTLHRLAGTISAAAVDEAEMCSEKYLAWALPYVSGHAQIAEASKARHAAFVAYAKSLNGSGGDPRALQGRLDEADARLMAEAVAVAK